MNKEELKAKRKHLAEMNRRYNRDFTDVPKSEWPKRAEEKSLRIKVLRSRDFMVQIFLEKTGDAKVILNNEHVGQGTVRITVNRTELDRDGNWKDGITWEELLWIKFECGFGDAWAVEVFPCESQVVNDANMRHLWIVPKPEFAWVS